MIKQQEIDAMSQLEQWQQNAALIRVMTELKTELQMVVMQLRALNKKLDDAVING